MRRLLALMLLLAVLTAQAPIACLNGGAHATNPDEAPTADALVAVHHGHHGGEQADAARDESGTHGDSATTERPDSELPCTALARCHWAALPVPGAELRPLRDLIAAADHALYDRPAGPVSAYPTPPPRHIS